MNTKTKIVISWCMAILMIIAISPFTNANSIYQSVIRLHVLAESDSENDQELKLSVRDEILAFMEKDYNEIDDIEEAKEKIARDLPEIERIANEVIKKNGFSYTARVTFGEEYYPTRFYDSLSFPKGKYLSLKVTLGNGNGHNWWCVLFPPICTQSATDTTEIMREKGVEEANIKTVTRDGSTYVFKFKLLEMISDLSEKLKAG